MGDLLNLLLLWIVGAVLVAVPLWILQWFALRRLLPDDAEELRDMQTERNDADCSPISVAPRASGWTVSPLVVHREETAGGVPVSVRRAMAMTAAEERYRMPIIRRGSQDLLPSDAGPIVSLAFGVLFGVLTYAALPELPRASPRGTGSTPPRGSLA